MTQFCRFDLRTTDVSAARAFYARIFGHDRAVIWPLHEQALARGARPHWLGQLGVEDVEGAVAAFVQRGATQLGPARAVDEGGHAVVLRDPGGALIALGTARAADAQPNLEVVWHVLNTNNAASASANYHELFGWELGERSDAGAHGNFQPFAFSAGGANAGVIGDIAARPGVHPHWLFVFQVAALEPVLAATRAAGGLVLDPIPLPGGGRLCVCDDPQGAAFALRER
jgi:uncharacterized protein